MHPLYLALSRRRDTQRTRRTNDTGAGFLHGAETRTTNVGDGIIGAAMAVVISTTVISRSSDSSPALIDYLYKSPDTPKTKGFIATPLSSSFYLSHPNSHKKSKYCDIAREYMKENLCIYLEKSNV